jgi:hypothetical protein
MYGEPHSDCVNVERIFYGKPVALASLRLELAPLQKPLLDLPEAVAGLG